MRPRLLAAVPVLVGVTLLAPGSATAALPDSCHGQVDVVLGTPRDDVGGDADAGSVTVVFEPAGSGFGGSSTRTLTEDDLGGTAGAGHGFGTAVAWGFDDTLSPGCSLVAVGAPGADGGAGRVYVFVVDKDGVDPGSVSVLQQGVGGLANIAEPGDAFGSALHFGGDLTVRWLAIGSPGESVGSATGAGLVHVVPVRSDWGTDSVSYRQGAGGVGGTEESGDRFGAALGPGYDVWSLWVGAPGEDLGSTSNAGAVSRLPGRYDAGDDEVLLPGTVGGISSITQDTKGVPSSAESGDQFGAVLSGFATGKAGQRQPVIGVPYENVGKAKDAGMIVVAYVDKSFAGFEQGTKGNGGKVDGAPESGDRFGAALAAYDLVVLVGAPGEAIGSTADAGAIHAFTASSGSYRLSPARETSLTQNSPGVEGGAEAGDGFGTSVALAVNGGVVGVPGEDYSDAVLGDVTDGGVIAYFPYVGGTPTGGLGTGADAVFGAGSDGIGGTPEAGARFGSVASSVTQ